MKVLSYLSRSNNRSILALALIFCAFALTFQAFASQPGKTYIVYFPDSEIECEERGNEENAFISELLSLGVCILSTDDESAVLKAGPDVLEKLRKRGFAIEERENNISPVKQGRSAQQLLGFELSTQFPPKVFPGEQIDELWQSDIDNDGEREIILSTNDGSDTSGNVYVFSPDGTLEWSRFFAGSGVDYIAIHDFDNNGTDEILTRLSESNTFYVLSHTGADEWSGTVTDNIVGLDYYHDLNNDGKDDIIAYSRDTSVPRGQVTTFDFAAQAQMGVRHYTAADLAGPSPWSSREADLDGDGFMEIIPDPRYLKQKFEILDYTAAVKVTKSFTYDVESYDVEDLNGDGRDDIIVEIMDGSGMSDIFAYMDYTGNDFNDTWSYPPSGFMLEVQDFKFGDGRIAFGTQNDEFFTGGKVYLLDSATGTDIAQPANSGLTTDDVEYRDLDGDGDRDLAVLSRWYDESSGQFTLWIIQSYDQNLDPFPDAGFHGYSLSSSSRWDTSSIAVNDLTNDGFMEILPLRNVGPTLHVVRYNGVLKWQYDLAEDLEYLSYYTDINNDGQDDLVVGTGVDGVSGHAYSFSDGGTSGILLGSQAFPDTVNTIYRTDFNNDGYYELIPKLYSDVFSYVYSYNFGREILAGALAGDKIRDVDYSYDMNGNGIDDLFFATNDQTSTTAYLYLFLGTYLPAPEQPKLAVMKKEGTEDVNLYYYNSLVRGDWNWSQAYFRNHTPYCRDQWKVPAGNDAIDITAIRGTSTPLLYALRKREPGNLDLYLYSGLAKDDWTFSDALARNGWPRARDLWFIPGGDDAIGIEAVDISSPQDGTEELAILKKQNVSDLNLYYYKMLVTSDWSYWDAASRNPSPVAKDLWIIPGGNNAVDFTSVSSGGGVNNLMVVKRDGINDLNVYMYNNPVEGDWTYWDAIARNPSPLARDLWVLPSGNNIKGITAIDADGDGTDELAIFKEDGPDDINIYYYNALVPGDWTYWDCIARNPSPLARDLWFVPDADDILGVTAAWTE